MRREKIVQSIIDAGVIAIIRMIDTSSLMDVLEALVDGGIRCIEITLTVPGAYEIISTLAANSSLEILVGGGTVLDAKSARRAIDAGAQYLVSPTAWMGMIKLCRKSSVVSIPGAFTPTEIYNVWRSGADIVKVFPANAGGPQYITDVMRPFPELRLLPTSGITVENAAEYIKAGACAVWIGAALTDPELVKRGEFLTLRKMSRQLLRNIKRARSK